MSTAVSVKKKKGIFPGWLMVIAGAIICFWGQGVFTYAFGAYVKPLIADFGWSRAQISFAHSFSRLEGGIEGPFGGIATDKWGPRVVNLIGIVMLGLGFILMYFVNALWMFYIVWIAAAIGGNLGLVQPLETALANWFIKRRGFAVGVMRAVACFCGPVVLPLVAWFLVIFGWRIACPIFGVVTLLIGVPLTWFFIKPKRPEYYGWLPDGGRVGEEEVTDTEAVIKKGVEYAAGIEEVEFTLRQALKDRIFWIFTIASAFFGMASPVLTVHLIPHVIDMGFDPVLAAAVWGINVLMGSPSRLLAGWLGDRVSIRRLKYLVMASFFLVALGVFILTKATNLPLLWVCVVVYGFGHGATYTAMVPLRGRYWGRKAYATIQGVTQPITMILSLIAPVWAGWAYDTTGSYQAVFNYLFIFVLVAVVVMFFANPPKPPEKVTHITDVV